MRPRATAVRMSADEAEQLAGKAYDHELFLRIWRFIKPHWRLLLGSLLLLPLASVLQLLPPYLLKEAIDNAIVVDQLERLAPYALALVAVLLTQQLANFGQTLLMQLCGQRAMHDLRVATHRHLLGLRISYFDRTPIGRVMTRVTNDVESIAEAFASGLISLVGDAITLVGIVVAMLLLHPGLALLTFAVLPILLVVVLTFQRVLRRAYRLIRRRLARINATLQEQINGIAVVQIFGRERRAQEEFDQVNRAYRDGYKTSIKYDAALFALVEMLGTLTIALLLWYGGLKLGGNAIAGGPVTFGLLVAFIEYVQKFFIPIRDMSAKYAVMQQAMAAAERVFELLETNEPDAPTRPAASAPPAAELAATRQPHLLFDGVTFGYEKGTPVLHGLSFAVEHGDNIAVVGATGAGKSTLVRLLTRLYEIDDGAILLSGGDIRQLPVAELRRRVVVLSQDVFLFAGTVFENIALGDPTIDHAAVTEAARRIGLLDLVPLQRQVLERGTNLSAGERQLVVFARALVRDPELLVLDEATANVDPESERIVQDGIAELLRERTAIIIAHRLSTIERVDRVLVLSKGQLVEQGPHAELLARGGLYRRLYELQYVATPEQRDG